MVFIQNTCLYSGDLSAVIMNHNFTCFFTLIRTGILIIHFCAFWYLCSGFWYLWCGPGYSGYGSESLFEPFPEKESRQPLVDVKWLQHSWFLWFVLIFEVIFKVYVYKYFTGLAYKKGKIRIRIICDRIGKPVGTVPYLFYQLPLYRYTTHEIKVPTPVAMVDILLYSFAFRRELGQVFRRMIVHNWTWGLNLLSYQDTTLYCCDGPMLLSKMFVGLLFPHLQGN